MKEKENHSMSCFERFAKPVSDHVGKAWVFLFAFSFVAFWLFSGPFFDFSDTWQLIINSVSSAVTFLMVFIIQHTQNRETKILNLKLDEIIKAIQAADNKTLNLAQLSNEDLKKIEKKYTKIKNKKTGE